MATTTQEVRSAAELERQRVARQAERARASATAQAQAAEAETEAQAREARAGAEAQARKAREEARAEAEARQADIRKQQGATEAQAQAMIGKARQVKAKEARKRDLPSTMPRSLGISAYIASIDAARKQAHKAGKAARATVKEIRDEYIGQVEEWQSESLASIDKQLKGIQADIAKSVIKAQTEIAKQQATLNAGVKEWETQALKDIAEFEGQNTKLDSGDWVDKDLFEQLPPDYQHLLKTVGVDKFNTQVKAEIADFENKHTEIKPELWVSKTEWAKLTTAQQKEVTETGQYTTIPTADEAFQQLKNEGKIPDTAILKSYDDKTGELTYTALKTSLSMDEIMKHWNDLNPEQKRIQINGALHKPVYGQYKDFSELTKDERDAVLVFYTQSYLPVQTKDTKHFQNVWAEQKVQLKEMGLGMIPIYGTIRNWDRMSPTWRGISIALDIAVILPMIKAAGQGIKAMTLGIKTRVAPVQTAASVLAKAETALSRDMAGILKKAYSTSSKAPGLAIANRKLATSYTDMIKAQGKFLNALAHEADLVNKGKIIPAKLKTATVGYESKLRIAATEFVNRLYGSNSQLRGIKNVPVRFDSPELARIMNSLPTEMVHNSKMAIAGIQLKSTNVKALTQAVDRAEAALKAAQTKYPKDPSRWVDLMYGLSQAQGRLAQAKTGTVTKLYQELLKARNAGKGVKAAKLQQQLDQAINSMEIEWGRLGFSTGGRVGVATAKPLSPTYSPSKAPTTIGAKVPISQAVARAITLLSTTSTEQLEEWIAPGATSTPEVIAAAKEIARALPKIDGVTSPEIIALTEAALRQSVKSSLEGKTIEEVRTNTINAIEPIIKEWLATEQITKTEAKAITATAVKTAVKTATELKITHKPKVGIGTPKVSAAAKDGRYPDGTIIWRMGSLRGKHGEYKIIPPPYTLAKPISVKKPPRGMKRTKGTPQQTLTFIGGKVPFSNVSFDLGVIDGFIDVKNKTIAFTGGGEKTDVGTRLPSPTRGVALTDKPPLLQELARKPRAVRQSAGGTKAKPINLNIATLKGVRRSRLATGGVYSDKKGERLARKKHRGWTRIY